MEHHDEDMARIKRALWGDEKELGLSREVPIIARDLNKHLVECATRHSEAARKAEEKRMEDVRFYKGILASIITSAIIGIAGLVWLGVKLAAKS